MREIRLSGSEGGGFELNRFSLPLLLGRPFGAQPGEPLSVLGRWPGLVRLKALLTREVKVLSKST